ncbi:MAG: hypothetical protein J6S40_03315 [Thermoguttaceae bacterium]|nr:hypothetical protein [Thermoguttaceae bacterium]
MNASFKSRKLRLESLEERTLLAVVAGGMAQAAHAAPTEASTWLVNTTDDPTSWDTSDDILSLREAIDIATEGDTILFDASLSGQTIVLSGEELTVEKGISIDATGIGGITIDADGQSRVFNIIGGDETSSVELIGLTITGGDNSYGGGIYNYGTLTITNSTISGNTASYGGGIYNYNGKGTLIITNSTISWNTASSGGGGIYNYNGEGTLTITNSTISGNTAFYGGGIHYESGTLTITNSTISGNTASYEGGGICNYYSDMLTLTNTIVSLNYAGSLDNVGSYSGSNNIVGNDPGFVVAPVFDESGVLTNAATLDLSLAAGSAAINTGTNDAVETEFDIAGNPRIVGGTVDIGAYEYQGNTESPSTVVTTLLDIFDTTDGMISLREAVFYASEGDTVTFDSTLADGTITLDGSQLEITKGITVDATGIGGITIDADGKSRVFYITGGDEMNPVELIGLTVTGGVLTNDHGGGIFNRGVLAITDSTITGNVINYTGDYSSMVSGGGICNEGTLTVTNTLITENTSGSFGGGISNGVNFNYDHRNASLTIINSTVTRNTVAWYGGGFFNSFYCDLTIVNSTISGNNTGESGEGGGVWNDGDLTITNSVIYGNSAGSDCGGICLAFGSATIVNSTIAGNTSRYAGCNGISCGIGGGRRYELTLTNSIVALNRSWVDDSYDYSDDIDISFDGSNNIIGFDPGFAVAPVFEDGVLINADEIDLSLTEGSVAIDAGMNDAVTTEFDIAGNPRIVNGIVDIGAYEYHETSTVVTTLLDIVDEWDSLISLREAIAYAAEGEVVTFDASLSGQTIVLGGSELTVNKSLAIDATDIGGITIDAAGQSWVFDIIGGDETSPVELIGLTITGGNCPSGGGIFNQGTLTITNSTISGNTASYEGGGIYNEGMLTVVGSTISGNSSGYSRYGGGGIINLSGTVSVIDSTISENTSEGEGGGIYNYEGVMTITNSTVSGNNSNTSGSGAGGGGIFNIHATLTIIGSTISGNNSNSYGGRGGGINNWNNFYTGSESTVTIIDSIITGNTAAGSGGSGGGGGLPTATQ